MPRGDRTGPDGMGAMTGEGSGSGRPGGGYGATLKCPNCGKTMMREELLNNRRKDG